MRTGPHRAGPAIMRSRLLVFGWFEDRFHKSHPICLFIDISICTRIPLIWNSATLTAIQEENFGAHARPIKAHHRQVCMCFTGFGHTLASTYTPITSNCSAWIHLKTQYLNFHSQSKDRCTKICFWCAQWIGHLYFVAKADHLSRESIHTVY